MVRNYLQTGLLHYLHPLSIKIGKSDILDLAFVSQVRQIFEGVDVVRIVVVPPVKLDEV